jgi:hypothetical protein
MSDPATLPTPHVQKLQGYLQDVKNRFDEKHAHASEWLQNRSLNISSLRTTSQQLLAAASLAGQIALNKPVNAQVNEKLLAQEESIDASLEEVTTEEKAAVLTKLQQVTSLTPGHLPQEEELYLEQQLSDILGFEVTAELDDNRLNHSIGIMGGEQHLRRFPTDTIDQHDAFLESGIAPNRGAFGWFTENGVLTDKAIQREKYYFAVQTLYLPDWNQNHAQLKPWYQFRKMIAINAQDQIAVVGVVGDAGPAQSTGKQFGGSPEVIREGKIWSKTNRGKVLLLFVDDPNDEVPLGVIDISQLFNGVELAQR